MGKSTIGIKIANGNYYPIIEEDVVGKKRLILTTVNDHQQSVQIDLYRGEGDTLAEASYIGSLILENMVDAQKGEPEVELILGIDGEGNLSASAADSATGERQSLALSLDALSEEGDFDLPQFDIDASIEPSSDITSLEEDISDEFDLESDFEEEFGGEFEEGETAETPFGEEEYSEEEAPPPREKKGRLKPGLLVLFVILGLAIIGLLAFLVYRNFRGEEIPPLLARMGITREVPVDDEGMDRELSGAEGTGKSGPGRNGAAGMDETAPEVTEAGPERGGRDGPETAVEVPRTEDAAPQPAEQEGPAAAAAVSPDKLGGVWYWIKWGDTLWDLSNSFYRTPFLYGKIAKANNIKNPDKIYAQSKIFIPEK